MITGCCFGMLLFSTYLLRSGTGGHWVLSIYWLMSGAEGQGGTVAFRTYLLKSGCLQGGQTSWVILPCCLQVHWGAGLLQFVHMGITDSKPSLSDFPPKYLPRPKPTPRIRMARARRTRAVNLGGLNEAISSSNDGLGILLWPYALCFCVHVLEIFIIFTDFGEMLQIRIITDLRSGYS